MTRVLLIEDERDIVFLYRTALEGAGFEIVGTYHNPVQLLEDPPAVAPDIILLDERLEGYSGSAYLQRIRDLFPEAQIVLATADPATVRNALELGADEAKAKPFSIVYLIDNLRGLAARGRRELPTVDR